MGVLAATLTLAACGGGDTTGTADAGPPQPGGTLRYGLSGAPTCSDPAQSATNQTLYVTRQIVDSLTDQDPATGELRPWLADSWFISQDAKSFTFHLKDGITFSDGTPLTADSVRKNFDSIVALGAVKAPLGATYLAGYTGSTVVDPRTVRVEFDSPNAQFLQASSTAQLGIQSDATVAKSADERCLGGNVGSGPFSYGEWKQNASATLLKRTGYTWGSAIFANKGDAYLDRIVFTVVPETGVRTGSLSSGQLDAISDALPQDVAQIEGAGGRVEFTTNPGIPFGLQLNVTRGPLRDAAVRAALTPALNRQELVDTVLGPQFKPATSVLASRTPGYADLSSRVRFDQAAAKQALDEAGWVAGGDGIRAKNGERLAFNVVYSAVFAGNQAVLELTQQQLRAVGVELKLEPVPVAEATARQNNKDFDTYYYNSSRADGDILRSAFALNGRNLNVRNAPTRLDDLLARQLAATDATARTELLADAQNAILDEGLWLPTIELSQAIGAGSNVQAVTFDASARLSFHDTWVRR
ncbi:ABC transporter substrate-binding protein [Nocardia sp. 2]|uniref:ABC transporter substrate-binding protein n=1 Tax=Nocardia acididurans TaxID=2802282 RepID=A0ABS1M2W5_9NOCA|nr:ABC transporter substrate-binding protein [Nocardia acididurans]MBL1073478.1 ABC transporter substrate-binding protein [Nocardia acididurans]